MICVDGYKAFRGTMRCHIRGYDKTERGEWLYKPEYKCWYGKFPGALFGCESFPEELCEILEDET